jgi:hypothetical protein
MARPQDKFVSITIDEKPHKPVPPVTGAMLYQLGQVAENMELWIEARGQGDDSPVPNDTSAVELRPGDRLYTARRELNPGVAKG